MRKSFVILLIFSIMLGVCGTGCLQSEEERERANMKKIEEAMSSVCQGQGVAEAATYTKTSGLHPIIVDADFAPFDYREEWLPKSIAETQLVACVVGYNRFWENYSTCGGYSRNLYKGPYYTVLSQRHYMNAQLREAKTGKLIQEIKIYGDPPRCPVSIESTEDIVRGDCVTDDQINNVLQSYVVV
ncbi:MAG: hypothetical protein LUQ62_00295 [Methanomicrobiales archaeon]|nr:hypothetical protein [Methanomicrobiales archaeon]